MSSIPFDRAADYYDRTRGLTKEGARRTNALLVGELRGRGPILEIGVGTGQLALPLSESGLPVVGLDLARPMMERLVAKAGGSLPVPLVQGDATNAPLRDDAFGGAYLRWVLHLIPDWPTVASELVRVVRPGGVILANHGSKGTGPRAAIHEHFAEAAGLATSDPVGLAWNDGDALDDAMRRLGATPRELPPFIDVERDNADAFMTALEQNLHSWEWSLADDVRARAAAETRAWAEGEFGPLDAVSRAEHPVVWRAYDV
jgi:Methylase involved in ubiquinone/menaquinone biosynthesis